MNGGGMPMGTLTDAPHYCGLPQTAMLTGPIPPNVKGLPESGDT